MSFGEFTEILHGRDNFITRIFKNKSKPYGFPSSFQFINKTTVNNHSCTIVHFSIVCYNYYTEFDVFAPGCGDSLVEMHGSNGTIGVSRAQYSSNMRCTWKIQVALTKASKTMSNYI